MHYTYIHRRESDNAIFYTGKGKGRRAWSTHGRSEHWHRVKAKHGCKVEIVAPWPTEAETFEHEKFLISCFRAMGEPLVNLTEGGEGATGFKFTERQLAHRKKIANSPETKRATAARLKAYNRQPHVVANKIARLKARNMANSGDKSPVSKRVMCIETGQAFPTLTLAAAWASEKGVGWMVSAAASGKRKSAYGHTWKFMEKETV
jgi:hypothetical protein